MNNQIIYMLGQQMKSEEHVRHLLAGIPTVEKSE